MLMGAELRGESTGTGHRRSGPAPSWRRSRRAAPSRPRVPGCARARSPGRRRRTCCRGRTWRRSPAPRPPSPGRPRPGACAPRPSGPGSPARARSRARSGRRCSRGPSASALGEARDRHVPVPLLRLALALAIGPAGAAAGQQDGRRQHDQKDPERGPAVSHRSSAALEPQLGFRGIRRTWPEPTCCTSTDSIPILTPGNGSSPSRPPAPPALPSSR